MRFVIGLLGTATWAEQFVSDLRPYLVVVFALLGVASVGYALYLGFLLAKASDESKRQQAKSRIMKTIFGLLIIVALTVVFVSDDFFNAIFGGTTDRVPTP